MVWEDIIILVAAIALSAVITIGYKLIKKQWFKYAQWFYAASPIVAFVITYYISESYDILTNLKDLAIWTFILIGFVWNIKCLIRGSKRSWKSGKGFIGDIKSSLGDMKSVFKKNKQKETKTDLAQQTEENDDSKDQESKH